MQKRFLAFFMAMVMILAVGCGGAKTDDTKDSKDAITVSSDSDSEKEDDSSDSGKELKILAQSMPGFTEFRYHDLLKQFEAETGIKVTVEGIEEMMPDDYAKKVITKLHAGDIPSLMYIEDVTLLDRYNKSYLRSKLVDNGVAEDLSNKVNTYDNLLDMFKTQYFIPTGINISFFVTPKSELKKVGLEVPSYNLSENEIYDIWYKIHPEKPAKIDYFFYKYITSIFSGIEFDRNGSNIDVSYENFIKFADNIKNEIKSDKYVVEPFEDYETSKKAYTTDDPDDMEAIMSEITKYFEFMDSHENYYTYSFPYMWNFSEKLDFYSFIKEPGQVKASFNKEDVAFIPSSYVSTRTAGFMVPKSAKNKDNAYKFLEWITSEEIQNQIAGTAFTSGQGLQFYGPILKNTPEAFDKYLAENELTLPPVNDKMIEEVYATLNDPSFIDMYMSSMGSEDMNYELLIKQYLGELIFDYVFKEDITEDEIKSQLKASMSKLNTFLAELE